jgi:hypothetical protein
MDLLGQGGDVEDLQSRVGGRFEEDQTGAVVEESVELLELMAEQEMGRDAEQRQLLTDQLQGAAVGIADTDDAVAPVSEEERGLRRHAGGEGERGLGPFQGRQLLLQGEDAGVQSVARIEASGDPTLDDIEQRRGRGKGEGRGGIDRRMGAAVRIGALAGMDAAGGQAVLGGCGHGLSRRAALPRDRRLAVVVFRRLAGRRGRVQLDIPGNCAERSATTTRIGPVPPPRDRRLAVVVFPRLAGRRGSSATRHSRGARRAIGDDDGHRTRAALPGIDDLQSSSSAGSPVGGGRVQLDHPGEAGAIGVLAL